MASFHEFESPPSSVGGPSQVTRGGCAGQPPATPPVAGDSPRVSLADIARAMRIIDRIDRKALAVAILLGGHALPGFSPNVHNVAADVFDRIPGVAERGETMTWKRAGSICIFRAHDEAS